MLLDIEEDETDRGVINHTWGSRLAPETDCISVTVTYAKITKLLQEQLCGEELWQRNTADTVGQLEIRTDSYAPALFKVGSTCLGMLH